MLQLDLDESAVHYDATAFTRAKEKVLDIERLASSRSISFYTSGNRFERHDCVGGEIWQWNKISAAFVAVLICVRP